MKAVSPSAESGIAKCAGAYFEHGRPTPGPLTEVSDRLTWTGLVTVAEGDPIWSLRQLSLTRQPARPPRNHPARKLLMTSAVSKPPHCAFDWVFLPAPTCPRAGARSGSAGATAWRTCSPDGEWDTTVADGQVLARLDVP